MDSEDPIRLWYDDVRNVMMDEGGYVIFNIFYIISPQVLSLFKKKKEYMIVHGQQGQLVELFYPVDVDDNDVYYYDF
jgi:hypothetical protein